MAFEDIKKSALAAWEALHRDHDAVVFVGMGTCGCNAGATAVLERIRADIAQDGINAAVVETGCMGWCDREPLVLVSRQNSPTVLYGNVTPDSAAQLLASHVVNGKVQAASALCVLGDTGIDAIPAMKDLPLFSKQIRLVMENCGRIDPCDIGHALATGGYSGLVKALDQSPEALIDAIAGAQLRGRGGAGYPVAEKWKACRNADSAQKHIICNAAEGDPAAVKDRCLLESDPHLVLEGILIAAHATGATKATVFLNPEYTRAAEILQCAIDQMKEKSLLGSAILGADAALEIALYTGQGQFVCGEESALINVLSGGPARSKARPPYPAASGLNGDPTLVGNVETFAHVAVLLRNGFGKNTAVGTTDSPGTKLVTLAAGCACTGVVEVPTDMTLRVLSQEVAGGMPDGKQVKAVQFGGPTGAWIAAADLDIPICFEALSANGTHMGSGTLTQADTGCCAVDLAKTALAFIHLESCGKCVFGREGTRQLHDILTDLTNGNGRAKDLELLTELGETMQMGALCGLGKSAPNPVLSTLKAFRSEYDAHLKNNTCPAQVCAKLSK